MAQLILTVQERFQLSGRGLVLWPEVSADFIHNIDSGWTAPIRLVRPDGTELRVQAAFQIEHYYPIGYKWMCFPRGVEKEDVPIGTQIWLLDDEVS